MGRLRFNPCVIAAAVLAGAALGGCSKNEESLVVASLTTDVDAPGVASVKVVVKPVVGSANEISRTFSANGLSMDVARAYSVGVYVPSGFGTVNVSASASDGSRCYAGAERTSITSSGATVHVAVALAVGSCPTDGGSDAGDGPSGSGGSGTGGTGGAGTGGAGTGGAGTGGAGTGGVGAGGGGAGGTGTGGTAGGQVPPLGCTEFSHNDDAATATCVPSTMPVGPVDTSISDIAFTRDSKYLFTAGSDGRLKVWNWTGSTLTAEGHVFPTMGRTYLALSPSPPLVAAGSMGGALTIWNIGGPWAVAAQLTGITGDVYGVAFSPDGLTVYAVDNNSVLYVFTSASLAPQSTRTLTTLPYTIASSPLESDGTYWLAIGYNNGEVGLTNVGTGGLGVETTRFRVSPLSPTYALKFSPDGQRLAAGATDGRVGIWPVPLPVGNLNPLPPAINIITNWINYLAFSPSGTELAIAGGGSTASRQLGIWDLASGNIRANAPTIPYRPYSVAYTTEGTTIAVGMWNCGKVLICPTN